MSRILTGDDHAHQANAHRRQKGPRATPARPDRDAAAKGNDMTKTKHIPAFGAADNVSTADELLDKLVAFKPLGEKVIETNSVPRRRLSVGSC